MFTLSTFFLLVFIFKYKNREDYMLHWPLDTISISQYFGPEHDGVDLQTASGTPVKAAFDGTVSGLGDTDLISGCYSYGKWIMISHPDGLSTLYAHLSSFLVSKDQAVQTGEIIGHSGQTGNATGPHLHFGVYITQGVIIEPLANGHLCDGAIFPSAESGSILDPILYLPPRGSDY